MFEAGKEPETPLLALSPLLLLAAKVCTPVPVTENVEEPTVLWVPPAPLLTLPQLLGLPLPFALRDTDGHLLSKAEREPEPETDAEPDIVAEVQELASRDSVARKENDTMGERELLDETLPPPPPLHVAQLDATMLRLPPPPSLPLLLELP